MKWGGDPVEHCTVTTSKCGLFVVYFGNVRCGCVLTQVSILYDVDKHQHADRHSTEELEGYRDEHELH